MRSRGQSGRRGPMRDTDAWEGAFQELQQLLSVFANLVPTERIQVREPL